MYASHPQFEQTTALNEIMGEGTGGVTESLKRRVILPFGGTSRTPTTSSATSWSTPSSTTSPRAPDPNTTCSGERLAGRRCG